jgi:glyoxylase-like metal-dependent hydrolase (beta-lactamase superfamily II)
MHPQSSDATRALSWLSIAMSVAACSPSVDPNAMLEAGSTMPISEHVYVIPSKGRDTIPNVGIIVGNDGTLVVDSGLGARNGAIVWDEVRKVQRDKTTYVTSTHFHPEHIGGQQGFPADAKILRLTAQQSEVESKGDAYLKLFRGMSKPKKELLRDFQYRKADTLFDREYTLDLGGVTVKLFSLGPAHTRGDLLIHVVEDNVLFGGDIAQKKLIPMLPDADSSSTNWLTILDQLEALQPRIIVPSHGDLGDQSLIPLNRDFLLALRARVRECKQEHMSTWRATRLLRSEFGQRYSDWSHSDFLPSAVERIYAEL